MLIFGKSYRTIGFKPIVAGPLGPLYWGIAPDPLLGVITPRPPGVVTT